MWTSINFVVSICFSLLGRSFYDFWYAPSFLNHSIELAGKPSFFWTLSVCLPIFSFSILCYVVLLTCKIRGKRLYKRSAMDMDWDLIDPDNIQREEVLELTAVQKHRRLGRRYSVWISQKKIPSKITLLESLFVYSDQIELYFKITIIKCIKIVIFCWYSINIIVTIWSF